MGIAKIEVIGANARFYLYVDQQSFDRGHPADRLIVAKIILPLDSVPECIRQAMEITLGQTTEKVVGAIKRLAAIH